MWNIEDSPEIRMSAFTLTHDGLITSVLARVDVGREARLYTITADFSLIPMKIKNEKVNVYLADRGALSLPFFVLNEEIITNMDFEVNNLLAMVLENLTPSQYQSLTFRKGQ